MTLRTLTLIAATLAGSVLGAQEGPRFGLQAGLNLPQSDLKDAVDSKTGFTLGAQATIHFRGGHMLRPRLDYTSFPEYTFGFGGSSFSYKWSNVSLGADYMYFTGGKPEGFYLTGGLAAIQWKLEGRAEGTLFNFSDSVTTTKPGFAVGAGYQFNKTVGAEARYLKSRASEADMDMIQVGATFRF